MLENFWWTGELTMVLVTHDSTIAARAQRIGLLRDGLRHGEPARTAATRLTVAGSPAHGAPVRAAARWPARRSAADVLPE